MGYHRAGFDVVGVDLNPQKNYPFEFIQADALTFPLNGFDAIHASPPCQGYSVTKGIHGNNDHPDYVDWMRLRLSTFAGPAIIENVPGAPLESPLVLCGTMFEGLRVYRHRLFEFINTETPGPPAECNHAHRMGKSKGEYHTLKKSPFITCVGHNFAAKCGRIAMGIPWMTRDELSQAIPPAYTEWIGKQLKRELSTT